MALPLPPELPEFIFGPLSTEEGRLQQARLDRSGLLHAVQRTVLAPEADEAALQASLSGGNSGAGDSDTIRAH